MLSLIPLKFTSFTLIHFSSDLVWIPHLLFHKKVDDNFDLNISLLMKASIHTSPCLGGISMSVFLLWGKGQKSLHSLLPSGPSLLRGYCLSLTLISLLWIETRKTIWKRNKEHSGSTEPSFNIKFTDFFFPENIVAQFLHVWTLKAPDSSTWQKRSRIKLLQRRLFKTREQPDSLRRHGKNFVARAVATQKVTDLAKTKPGSKDLPAATPWVGGELHITPNFFSCSWPTHFVFSLCSKIDQLV